MYGCIYCTKDGECDLYSEGGKFKAFCDMEHCDNIAPTHGDRIRSMTDEELADLFNAIISERDHFIMDKLARMGIAAELIEFPEVSVQAHLKWLKEVAD